MRRLSCIAAACALVACGRVGFDAELPGDGDGDGDGDGIDAPALTGACDGPDVLLCSGFEAGDQTWQPLISQGEIATVADMAFTGQRSLRAAGTGGRTAVFFFAPIPTVSSGSLFLRMWVRRPAAASAGDIDIGRFGDGIGNSEFFGVVDNVPGVHPGDDAGVFSGAVLPADAWACVQMAASSSTIELKIDGVDRASTPIDSFGPYSEIAVGLVRDGGTPDGSFEIFIDDLVASRSPIACD